MLSNSFRYISPVNYLNRNKIYLISFTVWMVIQVVWPSRDACVSLNKHNQATWWHAKYVIYHHRYVFISSVVFRDWDVWFWHRCNRAQGRVKYSNYLPVFIHRIKNWVMWAGFILCKFAKVRNSASSAFGISLPLSWLWKKNHWWLELPYWFTVTFL